MSIRCNFAVPGSFPNAAPPFESSIIPASNIGKRAQISDAQRPCVAEDGGSSIASDYVVAVAGTWDRCEVPDRDPPDVDTVSGIVGDRNAAKMEIGALIYEDAGSVITADGCETLEPYRRVFGGEDAPAGNWSLRWTSTAVSLVKPRACLE